MKNVNRTDSSYLTKVFIILFILPVLLISVSGCNNSQPVGKIAFASNLESSANFHIYVMNADGTNQIRLTSGKRKDESPSWSPDGKKIVFSSSLGDGDYNLDIYIINADGSGEKRLTDNPARDRHPAWSPDGKKIVFTSSRDTSSLPDIEEIYIMDADGSNQTRLTYYNAKCYYPQWSPDGSEMIFTFNSKTTRTPGVYIMKADGTGRASIIYDEEQENTSASFSPDGEKIVFLSVRPDIPTRSLIIGIFVSNADGSNQGMISEPSDNDRLPSWSPDGKMIVFNSPRGSSKGNYFEHIYVMNADGSKQTRLTEHSALNRDPVWSHE